MNLGDLLVRLRERLDDQAQPFLWADADLIRYLNNGVRQAFIRKRLRLDSQDPEVTRIAVQPDVTMYELHPRLLAIRHAWIPNAAARCPELRIATVRQLSRYAPDWRIRPLRAEPEWLIVDRDDGRICLYPTPDVAFTLNMEVWRGPLEEEDLEALDDEPALSELFHEDLIDWAEHEAFLKPDSDASNERRSDAAAVRFTAKFGRLPSAHEVRLWGVRKLRGAPAEFL